MYNLWIWDAIDCNDVDNNIIQVYVETMSGLDEGMVLIQAYNFNKYFLILLGGDVGWVKH